MIVLRCLFCGTISAHERITLDQRICPGKDDTPCNSTQFESVLPIRWSRTDKLFLQSLHISPDDDYSEAAV